MDKIIFLDMDGVLTHYSQMFYERPLADRMLGPISSNHIDHSKAHLFANFVNDNDIKVVLSSSWRKKKHLNRPETFAAYFHLYTGASIPVVGMTPNLGSVRGVEIQAYIDQHEIENYVILDDDSDMLPSQMHRFIHVSTINGLTLTDLIIASKMLDLDNHLTSLLPDIRWHKAFKHMTGEPLPS